MKLFRNLSIFVLTFLSVLVVSFYGCQKEVAQVSPKVGGQDLKVETRGLGDFVNVVNYNLYPDWTIGQYWQKARKGTLLQSDINFASYAKYSNYKISDIDKYQYGNGFGSGMAAKIRKEDFDFFIKSVLNNSSNYAAWFTFSDGQKCAVYRNWKQTDAKPKPFIIRDPTDMTFVNGIYKDGYISCNFDWTFTPATFGPPFKITFIPSTLKFTKEWDSANPGHVGIKPVFSGITKIKLQEELDKIKVEVIQ
jgi:hypothetical protein